MKYLRIAHRTKDTFTGPYDKLSRERLNEWFTISGEIRGHVSACVVREHAFVPQGQHMPPLQSHMDATTEFMELLLSMGETSVFLHAGIVQPIIIDFLQEKIPEVLPKWKVSLNWTRRFMRSRLNWRFRKPTTVKGKLPTDWINQGHMMTLRIAYLIKLYNIFFSLVVNIDQTSIHLVPLAGDMTWEKKESNDVGVIGGDDKRAISLLVYLQQQMVFYFRFN